MTGRSPRQDTELRSLTLISSFSPLLVSTDNSFAVFNVKNNPVQTDTALLLGSPPLYVWRAIFTAQIPRLLELPKAGR